MQDHVKPKTKGLKTKVTVEVDAALLTAAGVQGADLAIIFEEALQTYLQQGQARPLTAADRAAIEAHNRYVAEHGTLADSLRDL